MHGLGALREGVRVGTRRRAWRVAAAVSLIWATLAAPAAAHDDATSFYLGSDGYPRASLTAEAPTTGGLANYDAERDEAAGLLLLPSTLGLAETDGARYQLWTGSKFKPIHLEGPIGLRIWTAAPPGASGGSTMHVGVYNCNPSASQCKLLATGSQSLGTSETWIEHNVAIAPVEEKMPKAHRLGVKVVVEGGDGILLAYDTTTYPARIDMTEGPNLAPVPADDTAVVNEDGMVVIDVLGNDDDPDGDVLEVESVDDVEHGSVWINGDGTVTYQPDPDWYGVDTFEYEVTDSIDDAEATVTVTVFGVNDPPTAAPDEATTSEDTTVTVDLLANDDDVDGDPLTVLAVDLPVAGSVVDHGDGTITYTPAPDWNGAETFEYDLTDGAETASGVVTVIITPANDPPRPAADTATTDEDTPIDVDVLGNDTDIDGDTLVVLAVDGAGQGSTLISGSVVQYTPNPDFNGTDSLTYMVTDGVAAAAGVVTITVSPVNDAPVAADVLISGAEDSVLEANLLTEADDVEEDNLTLVSVDEPANGSLLYTPLGVLTYLPNADWNGVETLAFSVSDGQAATPAVVTIVVAAAQDAPIAVDDAVSGGEDVAFVVDPVANDSDVDGDLLHVADVGQPAAGGTVALTDETVVFMPEADWNGDASFTYTVSDSAGLTDVGVVVVTVNPVPDPPAPGADAITTLEDTPITVDVLANDTDPDGDLDPTSVTIVDEPSAGRYAVWPDGTITYTPGLNRSGGDVLTYRVCDDAGLCDTATLTVTILAVNDAPIANPDSAVGIEDVSLLIDAAANDTDVDDKDLTVVTVGAPGHGSAAVTSAGTIRYTPEPDFFGTDTITYGVSDPAGAVAYSTVIVNITGVNDRPAARTDAVATNEDRAITVAVLANDQDVDGDPLTVSLVAGPAHGAVIVSGDSFVYTPERDFHGADSFVYAVSDGSLPDTATAHVAIRSINDAPVATPDEVETLEEASVTIWPLSNDRDLDSAALTIAAFGQPAHGSVVVGDSTLTYTPEQNFFGVDRFSYTVTDGDGGFAAAVITVTVWGSDDPPALGDDAASTDETASVVVLVLDNDTDADLEDLTVTEVGQPQFGTVTLNDDGTVTYTPGPEFVGTDTFTYTATDGQTTQTATVTITRQIDGAQLVQSSLTPALITERAEPGTSDIIWRNASTVARDLALPVAALGAVGGTWLLIGSGATSKLESIVSGAVLPMLAWRHRRDDGTDEPAAHI